MLRIEVDYFRIARISKTTNCYIIFNSEKKKEDGAIVIDPGGSAQKIIQVFEDIGIRPNYVLLTHGHFDHWLAFTELNKQYNNLQLYICGYDLFLFEDNAIKEYAKQFKEEIRNDLNSSKLNALRKKLAWVGLVEPKFIEKQAEVERKAPLTNGMITNIILNFDKTLSLGDIHFHLLHTPGHSPGNVSFYTTDLNHNFLEPNYRGIIFSGDLVLCDCTGRTDIPHSYPKILRKSLKNKLVKNSELRGFLIFPGHKEPLTREKAGEILYEKIIHDFAGPRYTPFNELLELVNVNASSYVRFSNTNTKK